MNENLPDAGAPFTSCPTAVIPESAEETVCRLFARLQAVLRNGQLVAFAKRILSALAVYKS